MWIDQVAGSLPLVPLDWSLGLQISQSPQAKSADGPGDDGEGCPEQSGDGPQMQALLPEFHGVLQLLRGRPPLAAANTPSIRQ